MDTGNDESCVNPKNLAWIVNTLLVLLYCFSTSNKPEICVLALIHWGLAQNRRITVPVFLLRTLSLVQGLFVLLNQSYNPRHSILLATGQYGSPLRARVV